MSYENKGMKSPRYIVSSFGDGNYNTDGTSDETEINQAINDLTSGRTWQEMVFLKGDFTIDGPIVVPAWTYLQVYGNITRAADTTCTMLQNAHPATNDVMVVIDGGHWDGNRDNGGRGETIDWEHSTDPADNEYATVKFRNMEITDADDYALHVDAENSSASIWYFKNIHFRHCGRLATDYPIYFYKVYDVFMDTIHVSTYTPTIGTYFFGGGPYKITNVEWSHQTWFEQVGAMYMANCLGECLGDKDGFLIEGCNYGVYVNVYCRVGGDSAITTNSAFKLESSGGLHSHHNSFVHCGGGRRGYSFTNRWNYIFEEADTNQTDNRYKAVIADDYVTAVADIVSPTAKLDFIPLSFQRCLGSPGSMGVVVDAGGEHTGAHVLLPPAVRNICFITVDGYNIGGAAQEMEIELSVWGAAGNEQFNTHATVIPNLDCLETNSAAGDIITWRIRGNDYANIRAITAGDRLSIRATHEVGAGGDSDTNCMFGSAVISYV